MTDREMHHKLRTIIDFAPVLKGLFEEDVMISISDREYVLYNLPSKELVMPDSTNHQLNTTDPVFQAMKDNKHLVLQVPKDVYGIPFRIIISPIVDENRKVMGSISIIASVEKRDNLVRVAEQLAASSEEIAASTTEMSSSANDLTGYMNNLMAAYSDMNSQMNQTEKMLELINSIAQSSRILGLNAGIEAARSGEHGRGFSIVAKEITKLADRSAESVEQIRQLLNSIKEKVDNVAQTVSQTASISEHQSTAIEEISQSIQHLTDVAENIEELSKKI